METVKNLLMPMSKEMMTLAFVILAGVAFLVFIWKEHASDERDASHRLLASRVSIFVSAFIMTIGIVAEALHHDIDPWLVSALCVIVLAKIITRIYARLKK